MKNPVIFLTLGVLTLGTLACGTTSGSRGGTQSIGSAVVVQPRDDPAAVLRALEAVNDELEETETRIREVEELARPVAAQRRPPAASSDDPPE